jgi:hypothetical protein
MPPVIDDDGDQAELLRVHKFGLTFNCIDDVELLSLTGCTREVLFTAWKKYGDLVGSPIRKPCVDNVSVLVTIPLLTISMNYVCHLDCSVCTSSRLCGGAKRTLCSETRGDHCLRPSTHIVLGGISGSYIASASVSSSLEI